MTKPKLIGKVATELEVNPKTIRFYEDSGLIPRADRTPAGYRTYDDEAIERLAFVLRARALDFSIDDIQEILAFRDRDEAPCLYVTELIEQKINAVESRIDDLRKLRTELKDLRAAARSLPPETIAQKDCICHLIEEPSTVSIGAA